MEVRNRQGTTASGPFITVEQLAQRWCKSRKTIANLTSRGLLPLRPVRLYERADPVFAIVDVEQYEAAQLRAAGIKQP